MDDLKGKVFDKILSFKPDSQLTFKQLRRALDIDSHDKAAVLLFQRALVALNKDGKITYHSGGGKIQLLNGGENHGGQNH